MSAAALLFVAVPSVGMTTAGAAPAHAAVAHHVVDTAVMVESREVDAGPASAVEPSTYTVEPGDSLSAIARDQLGDADRWPELVDLNPVVADDPDLIYAGTVLLLPAPVAPAEPMTTTHTYTVRPGDTLSSIAARELGNAERYQEIFEASKNTVQPDGRQVTDPDVIDVGQLLTIPGTVVPVAATAAPTPVAATLEPEAEPAPTVVVPEPSKVPTSTYPVPWAAAALSRGPRGTFAESTVQIPARARSTARLRRALVAVAVAVVVVVSGRAAAETARALAVSWWTVRAALSAVAVLPCDVDDVPVHRLGVDEHHYRSVRYFQTTDGTWGRLEPVDDHLRVDPDTERALFAVPTHDRREPGWPR